MLDGIARWIRALLWVAAWALVAAAGYILPLWAAIALAVAVFGAQILLTPGRAACHLPGARRGGATGDAGPNRL